MIISHQTKIQHLLLRAGFAELPQLVDQYTKLSISKAVDTLFKNSAEIVNLNYIKDPLKGRQEEVSNFKILAMILRSKAELEELNIDWLNRITDSNATLREKMTLFWHNHFATSTPFAWLMQGQNDTLRSHALESFAELLHAIAKDPAMIIYLNNQQNKKNSPNENFAREVMELFTLGIGNYSEEDIKNAARSFTGWSVNRLGKFEMEEKNHDLGPKTIFGKTGNFSGEDVIEMLLANPQTANFIVTKIYKEFVNPTPDLEIIKSLADDFFKSGYRIDRLMKTIFTSDWFYDDKNIGIKIVSPIEQIVRFKRYTGFIVDENKVLLNAQKVLGQVLFFPPNVAGWKGGRTWIDSATLLLRLSFAEKLYAGNGFEFQEKDNYDAQATMGGKKSKQRDIHISSDWSVLQEHFQKLPPSEAVIQMLNYFIQTPVISVDKENLAEGINTANPQSYALAIVKIMSLPEFQLI